MAYLAGVATTPIAVYVFRKPIWSFLASEDCDKAMFKFMQDRLEYQLKRELAQGKKERGDA